MTMLDEKVGGCVRFSIAYEMSKHLPIFFIIILDSYIHSKSVIGEGHTIMSNSQIGIE